MADKYLMREPSQWDHVRQKIEAETAAKKAATKAALRARANRIPDDPEFAGLSAVDANWIRHMRARGRHQMAAEFLKGCRAELRGLRVVFDERTDRVRIA